MKYLIYVFVGVLSLLGIVILIDRVEDYFNEPEPIADLLNKGDTSTIISTKSSLISNKIGEICKSKHIPMDTCLYETSFYDTEDYHLPDMDSEEVIVDIDGKNILGSFSKPFINKKLWIKRDAEVIAKHIIQRNMEKVAQEGENINQEINKSLKSCYHTKSHPEINTMLEAKDKAPYLSYIILERNNTKIKEKSCSNLRKNMVKLHLQK